MMEHKYRTLLLMAVLLLIAVPAMAADASFSMSDSPVSYTHLTLPTKA